MKQLNTQSQKFAAAARQKARRQVSDAERAELARYDDWLLDQSRKTRELAARGGAATQPEAQ